MFFKDLVHSSLPFCLCLFLSLWLISTEILILLVSLKLLQCFSRILLSLLSLPLPLSLSFSLSVLFSTKTFILLVSLKLLQCFSRILLPLLYRSLSLFLTNFYWNSYSPRPFQNPSMFFKVLGLSSLPFSLSLSLYLCLISTEILILLVSLKFLQCFSCILLSLLSPFLSLSLSLFD